MSSAASQTAQYFDLMRVLIEYRHNNRLQERLRAGARRSAMHADALVAIHHLTATTNGSVLEVGGADIAPAVAALLALQDSPPERTVVSQVARGIFRRLIFLRQLKRAGASPMLFNRVVQEPDENAVSVFVLLRDASVANEIHRRRAAMAAGCWMLVDDYSRGGGRAGRTHAAVDELVRLGKLLPIGLVGMGTWIGRLAG